MYLKRNCNKVSLKNVRQMIMQVLICRPLGMILSVLGWRLWLHWQQRGWARCYSEVQMWDKGCQHFHLHQCLNLAL